MNSKRFFFFLFFLFSLTFSIQAEEDNSLDLSLMQDHLISKTYAETSRRRSNKQIERNQIRNEWKPFFLNKKLIEPKKTYFFNANVGVGFLYFSGIQGNVQLSGARQQVYKSKHSLQGSFRYNRTPLVEAILGIDWKGWLKCGLSYQHQANVVISSAYQHFTDSLIFFSSLSGAGKFFSNFNIDALMLKGYLVAPSYLVMKTIGFSSYLGFGAGVGWQTWTNPTSIMNVSTGGAISNLDVQTLTQKVSANMVFCVDTGFQLRALQPFNSLSVYCGCKYNFWGQARSIGKARQQSSTRGTIDYLISPISIKTVYSFAPYLGVQWNY